MWREVVDRYPEFNISVLHNEGLYLDLLQNMPTDLWQSAAATIACMALMCAVFMMPNVAAVCVATLVIASVMLCKYWRLRSVLKVMPSLAMLGILALQGVTMDPIVMVCRFSLGALIHFFPRPLSLSRWDSQWTYRRTSLSITTRQEHRISAPMFVNECVELSCPLAIPPSKPRCARTFAFSAYFLYRSTLLRFVGLVLNRLIVCQGFRYSYGSCACA